MQEPLDGKWGVLQSDGNWTGIVGTLQHQQGDFSVCLWVTEERIRVQDHSRVYTLDPLTIVSLRSTKFLQYLSIIKPFTRTSLSTCKHVRQDDITYVKYIKVHTVVMRCVAIVKVVIPVISKDSRKRWSGFKSGLIFRVGVAAVAAVRGGVGRGLVAAATGLVAGVEQARHDPQHRPLLRVGGAAGGLARLFSSHHLRQGEPSRPGVNHALLRYLMVQCTS